MSARPRRRPGRDLRLISTGIHAAHWRDVDTTHGDPRAPRVPVVRPTAAEVQPRRRPRHDEARFIAGGSCSALQAHRPFIASSARPARPHFLSRNRLFTSLRVYGQRLGHREFGVRACPGAAARRPSRGVELPAATGSTPSKPLPSRSSPIPSPKRAPTRPGSRVKAAFSLASTGMRGRGQTFPPLPPSVGPQGQRRVTGRSTPMPGGPAATPMSKRVPGRRLSAGVSDPRPRWPTTGARHGRESGRWWR